MRFSFGQIEVRTIKPEGTTEPSPPRKITLGDIAVPAAMACEKALQLYATKKTIDFIFGAATHIVVTKIR